MPLLTSLLLLIVSARLLGQLFMKFKQPTIVGEMLAGVLLGPSVLGVIHANESLAGISELAVFLVVLSAGLEMKFRDVLNAMWGKGLIIAVLGFALPLGAGIAVGVTFQLDVMRTIFLGLCVSITALPVSVRILQSLDLLDSNIARYSVAAAIFNDVAALLMLGVILNVPAQRTFHSVGMVILQTGGKLVLLALLVAALFKTLEMLADWGIHLERIPEKLVEKLGSEALFGIVLLFVLAFGSLSEMLGFHFVIGAFFAALLIEPQFFMAARFAELERTLGSITGGFLAPVFFAYLGLKFHIQSISSIPFAATVLAVSVGSKVLAGWMGGRLIGLSRPESLGIGFILNGRGIMELVIASIAYERGLIGQGLFSTLVLMGAVTTMITPLMFRWWVLPQLEQIKKKRGTA